MSRLFTPISVGDLELRNRVIMPPMVRFVPSMPPEVAKTQGEVTNAVLDHYRRRAAAGTAMIIVEATCVDRGGRAWEDGLLAYEDQHIPALARLADAIKAEGAKACIQLVHAGPQASPTVMEHDTVGPSAIRPTEKGTVPRALTVEEIHAIQENFAKAAARVAKAGFDAVDLHGAHGYLLDSFLSARRNQRTDQYGGSLDGRMRLMLETCRTVINRVGDQVAVGCRFSIFNKLDEGFAATDLEALVGGLTATGLDFLDVSANHSFRGYFDSDITIGQWVKRSTELPIIITGGMIKPEHAERAIVEGHGDMAGIGRAMLTDPDWTQHALEALKPTQA